MKKRIVLALGGNALQKNGEVTAEAQKAVAMKVGETIAKISDKYEIIITDDAVKELNISPAQCDRI